MKDIFIWRKIKNIYHQKTLTKRTSKYRFQEVVENDPQDQPEK